MMMRPPTRLFSTFASLVGLNRRHSVGAGSLRRVESCLPKSARSGAVSPLWLRRLLRLCRSVIRGEATPPEQAPLRREGSGRSLALLLAVRREFIDSLLDVRDDAVVALRERVRAACSLRELWHLRPDVFDIVARFHDQSEAERRLARLNRHFPTRSPRSGFGPL